MTLTQLLVVLLLIANAHAAVPSKITLHNDSTLLASSVVSNWTQLCQHLCSLNLSGPACGLECSSIPVKENVEDFNISSSKHRDELCETLCENGLGVDKCDCKVPITPFSSVSSKSSKPDKQKICVDFCRFHRVTIRGCPKCSPQFLREFEMDRRFERKKEEDSGEQRQVIFAPPPRPFQPPVPPLPSQVFPVPQRAVGPHLFEFQATTDQATTPDWNRVCATLCRNGSGGLLCNCDLPPV